jgi:hypothetical protein
MHLWMSKKVILQVASGELKRETFTGWLRAHIVEKKNGRELSGPSSAIAI